MQCYTICKSKVEQKRIVDYLKEHGIKTLQACKDPIIPGESYPHLAALEYFGELQYTGARHPGDDPDYQKEIDDLYIGEVSNEEFIKQFINQI